MTSSPERLENTVDPKLLEILVCPLTKGPLEFAREAGVDLALGKLTTIECRTGLPREIEIWFIVFGGRFYLFAETGEAAKWVKNIRSNPNVAVRIGNWRVDATARVLDRDTDRQLRDSVAAIAVRKYGWGDGLPVEIPPSTRDQ